MSMKRMYIVVVFLSLIRCTYGMDSPQGVKGEGGLPLVQGVAIFAIGVGNIVYGSWNGIMYGIQQALPSREESSKPKISAVLKDVVLPIGTGMMILLARSRSLQK